MSTNSVSASICGFDIGSENCYIGVASQGGIEIVLNDYSQRSTPNYVCLGDKQRDLGVSAKQKQLTNLNNTFCSLIRLIGRSYNKVSSSENLPFPFEQTDTGEVAIRTFINDEEHIFSATQLLAMLLTKLRQIAGMPVDCVINCPNHFTDSQRRALCDAARIAGLNPLRILQDLTAVGVYYRFYRFNSSNENSIVVFVDIGYSNTQCAITQFDAKKNQMQVLSVEYESNLGGKHFDEVLLKYFVQNHNLNLNKRATLRLLAECEKLKRQMSANSNNLPINIECLQDEKDFSSRMDRALFESLAEELLNAIENVFKRALENATVNYAELKKANPNKYEDFKLNAVEIVGGSSRIPAVKRIIKNVFGLEASSTLNADEAVARGCALQCAILSPSFKVAKQLVIVDFCPYQINCTYWYQMETEAKTYTVNSLFKRGDAMPFTRQICLNCRSLPMVFELSYTSSDNVAMPIGQFKVYFNEPLNIVGNKMKVRIRLDASGMISFVAATISFEEKSSKKDKGDENIPNENEKVEEIKAPVKEETGESPNEQQAPVSTTVDLKIEPLWIRGKLPDSQLARNIETEASLVLSDKKWKERLDARNELEGYVYEWRDRAETGRLDQFMTPGDKNLFLTDLNSIQQWLYEDEENGSAQSRTVYQGKLNELQTKFSNGVSFRMDEYNERNKYIEKLQTALSASKRLSNCDDEFDEEKMKNALNVIEDKTKWLQQSLDALKNCATWQDPPVTLAQFQEQINEVEKVVKAVDQDIMMKKFEKQMEEEKLKEEEKKEEEKKKAEEAQVKDQKSNGEIKEEAMEVDQ